MNTSPGPALGFEISPETAFTIWHDACSSKGVKQAAIGLLWTILVAAGILRLARYETTAGAAGAAPRAQASETPTLLLFLHPRCPCSRASVAELAAILAHGPRRQQVLVYVYKPAEAPDDWARTDITASAMALPGAEVRIDPGGAAARRFAVKTSGHVLLYDAGGRLRFSGGITLSRGHAGRNPGERAVISLLSGGAADTIATPVYGCPLQEE